MLVLNLEPDNFSKAAIAELQGFARYCALPSHSLLDDIHVKKILQDADVVWTRLAHRIDAAFLEMAPRLKFIASATTGLNHIDIDACAVRGIEVVSLRGETTFLSTITATAELTLSLMLECLRRTGRAHYSVVESGVFDRDKFVGRQLSGLTLGIIGMGRLGSIVAEYGRALRMNVQFCDPLPDLMLNVPQNALRVSFEELLRTSDIVSLHASYSPGCARILDRRAFSKMRSGSVFINTARGELVDEDALLSALRFGPLGAAAVDVLDDEVRRAILGAAHPLIGFAKNSDRLIITPHIGGACSDAMEAAELFVAKKLRSMLTPGS